MPGARQERARRKGERRELGSTQGAQRAERQQERREKVSDQVSIQNEYLNHRRVGKKGKKPLASQGTLS